MFRKAWGGRVSELHGIAGRKWRMEDVKESGQVAGGTREAQGDLVALSALRLLSNDFSHVLSLRTR